MMVMKRRAMYSDIEGDPVGTTKEKAFAAESSVADRTNYKS